MKINILHIVRDHFATLVNANSRERSWSDMTIFIVLPIVVSALMVFSLKALSKDTANTIISIVSIFVGLLFNVIVLLFDLVKKDKANRIKNVVLRETLTSICYTVIMSLIAILVVVATFIPACWSQIIFTFLAYVMLLHVFLTLFMIVKRMYNLFMTEFDSVSEEECLRKEG